MHVHLRYSNVNIGHGTSWVEAVVPALVEELAGEHHHNKAGISS